MIAHVAFHKPFTALKIMIYSDEQSERLFMENNILLNVKKFCRLKGFVVFSNLLTNIITMAK